MKAILEGTAEEFRTFFRTGGNSIARAGTEDFGLEQVCMFCGCTDEDVCPGGCSWVAPNVCSRCADIIHEALQQDVSSVQKAAKNVHKGTKNTFKTPERIKNTLNIDNLLIPAFEHDRKLKSSYKTLFFTEMDDGRAILSYSGTKLYVRREKVLELPYPITHGYFGKLKSGTPSNRATAIRFYREYLAEQKQTESEKKPEGEQKVPELKSPQLNVSDTPDTPDVSSAKPIFSVKEKQLVLNHFAEAEKFDHSKLTKNQIGTSIVYKHPDGRIAVKQPNHNDVVTTTNERIAVLKKFDKDALKEHLKNLNTVKQWILRKYIEDIKDDEVGALGMLRTDTRTPKE